MVLAAISYKYIIIAGVLVLMLIIGYIADATDFGHKKLGKVKPIKNPNEVEEVEDKLVNKSIEDVNTLNEDLNVPFGDVNVDSFTKLPEVDAVSEDLTVPLGETSKSSIEEEPEAVEALTEILEPIKAADEPEEEPSEEVVLEKPKKEKKTKKEKKEPANYEEKVVPEFITEQFKDDSFVSSDDDIWKF